MKKLLCCILGLLVVTAAVSAQSAESIDVSIRFYDKTVYYPDSASENPVMVKVSITNTGSVPYHFKLSDDRNFSMDFTVFNMKNQSLPQRASLVEKRTTSRTVYFREITIDPGEEYSFVENLKDYVQITDPSIYFFTVTFYPQLYKSKQSAVISNRLSLDIRPAPGIGAAFVAVAEETNQILKVEALSPDKVIEQTIIARQKGLWEQFFLYMDIEQMLMNDDVRNRKYRSASAEDRIRMITAYKSDLMSDRIDSDIVALPSRFRIERTEYNQTEGTVTVTEWFDEETFTRLKQYVYYLRQKDGIWQMYRYEVINLGTE